MTVTLRPTTEQDEPFLRRLIVESAALDLGAQLWPEPLRSQILESQYTGRRSSYRAAHPEAESSLIQVDGASAGWVVVAAALDEIYLAELIVQPEFRGRGIATAVLRGILETAHAAGKPVRLEVLLTNPAAIRLYESVGFRPAGGDQLRQWMEYRPES